MKRRVVFSVELGIENGGMGAAYMRLRFFVLTEQTIGSNARPLPDSAQHCHS